MHAAGACRGLQPAAAPRRQQQRAEPRRTRRLAAAPHAAASLRSEQAPLHRRAVLASLALCSAVRLSPPCRAEEGAAAAATALDESALAALQADAATAFAAQDFPAAERALSALIAAEPQNVAWVEGRAQVRVDAKRFDAALQDFDAALALIGSPSAGSAAEARLRSGRALALEGLSRWPEALADYDVALASTTTAGFLPDPYIVNSRGNVLASLGRWAEARDAYTSAAAIFQCVPCSDGVLLPARAYALVAAGLPRVIAAAAAPRRGWMAQSMQPPTQR